MKKIFTMLILLVISDLFAQPKEGYYNSANGKTDAALKTALSTIISANYVDNGYAGLYTTYETSDVTANGKVWDMYSTCNWTPGEKQCGNYSNVCDCYNREHSIPQSWFNEQYPMRSDAFHVYPTDGKVNGQRNNFPYGECSSGTTLSGGLGKLGSSTFAGYTGTVFEPVDEYKGDFARTYFYFSTRYQSIMTTIDGDSFNGTTYPALSEWSVRLFLKWHRQDPVSQKEIDRNNAIEVRQHNRNPFIDYPDLAEYIWGTYKGVPWSPTAILNSTKIVFSIASNVVYTELKVLSDETSLQYTIFDLNGCPIKSGELSDNKTITVSGFHTGMYLLKLSKDGKLAISKFFVNR